MNLTVSLPHEIRKTLNYPFSKDIFTLYIVVTLHFSYLKGRVLVTTE